LGSIQEEYQKPKLLQQLRNFSLGPSIGAIINIITILIMTRVISPGEFGRCSLFTMINSIFTVILPLGLDQAFVRYFNIKKYDKRDVLYSSIIPGLLFAIVLMFFLLLARRPLSVWLFDQYDSILISTMILSLPLLVIQRFGALILRMELRGKIYSILNIVSPFSNLFFFYC
jgi:O-antigen/teichoic acid export membrane protein